MPAWLAPVQVAVIPVADRHLGYAETVRGNLVAQGLRVEIDVRGESVAKKIREAEVSKVPFMVVVGDREAEEETLALRKRGSRDTVTLAKAEGVAKITDECAIPAVRVGA